MTTESYRNIILNKIKALDPKPNADDYIEIISNINLESDAATQNAIRDLYFNYCDGISVPQQYQDVVQEDLVEEPAEPQGFWNKIKGKMGWQNVQQSTTR